MHYKGKRVSVTHSQATKAARILAAILAFTLILSFCAIAIVPTVEATGTCTSSCETGEAGILISGVQSPPLPASLENARIICDFCADGWADARQWLVDNYNEAWPYGQVREGREAVNLGTVLGIAITANAMRESHCLPNSQQGYGALPIDWSAQQSLNHLQSLSQKSAKAWGIIQWDGSRRAEFIQFCSASKLDSRDLSAQLYFLAYEYYAGNEYSNYRALIDTYQTAQPSLSTAQRAAELYRVKVERGGNKNSSDEILSNWGNKWDDTWGARPEGGLYAFLYL